MTGAYDAFLGWRKPEFLEVPQEHVKEPSQDLLPLR